MATVVSSAVGKTDQKKVPTATHVVEFKKKETNNKDLVGKEAAELSPANYGPDEWWLLLEPSA